MFPRLGILLLALLLLPVAAAQDPSKPSCAIRSPASPLTVALDSSMAFVADCNDPDGDLARVEWYRDGAVVKIDTPSSAWKYPSSIGMSFHRPGTVLLRAVPVDGAGGTAASAEWSIVIQESARTAPVCARVGAERLALTQGEEGVLQARCTDAEGELAYVELSSAEGLVASRELGRVPSYNLSEPIRPGVGTHHYVLLAKDASGLESERVTWVVEVAAPPTPTSPTPTAAPPGPTASAPTPSAPAPTAKDAPSLTPGPAQPTPDAQVRQGDETGAAPSEGSGRDWTTTFTLVASGITIIGGAVVGLVLRYKRESKGEGEAAGPKDGKGGEGGGASRSVPVQAAAAPASSVSASQGAIGQVADNSGTINIYHGGKPDASANVPERYRSLHRALDEADHYLDAQDAARETRRARELVRDLMHDLEGGRRPSAEVREVTADCIEAALAKDPSPRLQEGATTLRLAAEKLRK